MPHKHMFRWYTNESKQILSSRRLKLGRRHKVYHYWIWDLILPYFTANNVACCCFVDIAACMRLLSQRQRSLFFIAQQVPSCLCSFPLSLKSQGRGTDTRWQGRQYTYRRFVLQLRDFELAGPTVLQQKISKPAFCPEERFLHPSKITCYRNNPEKWPQ